MDGKPTCLKRFSLGHIFSVLLGKLGYHVGNHPCVFLLVPLMITLVLSTGIQNLQYIDDAELLFSPRDGRSKYERDVVNSNFQVNQSGKFSVTRLTQACRMGRIVVTAKSAKNVLTADVFDEISQLDYHIQNFNMTFKGQSYNYRDICAHWNRECTKNSILLLKPYIDEIENGSILLTYPITLERELLDVIVLPAHLGGVKLNDFYVENATALMLGYYISSTIPTDDELGRLWENAFEEKLLSLTDKLKYININFMTSVSLQKELDANFSEGLPYVALSFTLMLVFTAVSCMKFDCVQSKSWLGMMGALCTTLGITSAYGLLIYCGVGFTGINFAIPFLALGIGLDDTFVMISCWKQTSTELTVSQRLQKTMEKAGISISITSATDFFSFWIGTITPFEAVRIFCIYIATTISFIYLCHVTMFAACMALAGYLEQQNRHGVIFIKVNTKQDAIKDGRNRLYQIFCSGGDKNTDSDQSESLIQLSRISRWLAEVLNKVSVKICILVAFAAYLSVCVWGIVELQEGLDITNLCRYDSNAASFFQIQTANFQQHRVQVIVEGQLDYSKEEVRSQLEDMLTAFENSEHMAGPMLTESWLREYWFELSHMNISSEEEFAQSLYNLVNGTSYELDINFGSDHKSILATRFLVQTKDIVDGLTGMTMMEQLRKLATTFSFKVTIFNPFFVYFDQFTLVRPYTVQCVVVASIVMLTVAILFLPDVLCAMCIGLAILSLEIGVVGLMSLWGIKLDAIAMINLIMCIGFSVDYSAHVAHAFLTSPSQNRIEQMNHAFCTATVPVLQGAFSTILALLPLLLVRSYIATAFFKIIFLVTILGGIHALILLPALLSTFYSLQKQPENPPAKPVIPIITISYVVNEKIEPLADLETDPGLGTSCTDDSSDSSQRSTPKSTHFHSKVNYNNEQPCRRNLSYKARMAIHKGSNLEISGGYDTDIEDAVVS
ncbi:hypothetical protein CHUAL_011706 [Chamberlinius hualienensis]